MKSILVLALFHAVLASFDSCASGVVRVKHLEADPPSRVASEQPVTMRVQFTVPMNTWIPDGRLRIATSLNYVPVESWEEPLCSHVRCPLTAGEHEVIVTRPFPAGVWGHVVALVTAVNTSGEPLMCARWTVWATGANTNETSRWSLLRG